jgi:hypothetical protein
MAAPPEMDAAILEYAEVAGHEPSGSPWAERDAELFQTPGGCEDPLPCPSPG